MKNREVVMNRVFRAEVRFDLDVEEEAESEAGSDEE